MKFKLDDNIKTVIEDISKDISVKATDIYVFGGYLRDNLLDRPPNDYDIYIPGIYHFCSHCVMSTNCYICPKIEKYNKYKIKVHIITGKDNIPFANMILLDFDINSIVCDINGNIILHRYFTLSTIDNILHGLCNMNQKFYNYASHKLYWSRVEKIEKMGFTIEGLYSPISKTSNI